ncbi:sigma factor-like helix-turn-helix DNA-binding protein [Sphingomonas sp.]|uniref:sigma factor-like helix-turn-helix DNA-binding protein n=1 Tax=Sphingomonas sp. TaxID=28214 RepID=UPI002EDB874F
MTPELMRLRRALDCMPEADRRVFELARFEALDYCQIAERLCLTVHQVEDHMAQAIRHLADYDQAR